MDQQNKMGAKCPCSHHKMVPIFIALLGLTFLLQALGVFTSAATEIIWPILVMAIGLQKIFAHKCKCCDKVCY